MRITANQITFARIFLLPIPCALLLFGGSTAWWVAFFLYTALGITDTIDGILARKYGATRLGGLIDPVADKIFMASILIAFTGLGYFPWWALSAIFCRELLVTALRSSVAVRHGQVKLTELAKLKTIIQMGGMGTFFWTMALPVPWLMAISGFAAICFFAPWVALRLRGKNPPFYLLPVGCAFLSVVVLAALVSKETSLMLQAIAIVAITCASAIEYVAASWRMFKKDCLTSFDTTRIFWAISYGFLALPVVGYYPQVFLPLLIGLSFELALGGLENVVTSEGGRLQNGWYLLTGGLAAMFGISSFLAALWWGTPVVLPALAWVLTLGSAVAFGVNFYRWRHLFAHAL
jgi:CDP-diacylglycerol--glycerol-3-phosphate 3-phosphatidyltransferase